MKFINIDAWQLQDISKTKKIICFGEGKKLRTFIRTLGEFDISKMIYFIIDNDKNKNNTEIEIAMTKLKVCSFTEFLHMDIKDCLIVITSQEVCSIYEQLCSFEQLKDISCCYSDFIRSETNEKVEKNRYFPSDLRVYDTPKIPKKIHYCWFGGKEIPEQNRIWMASWKKYCPDYEIMEWNESNYDISKNPYMYEAYQAGKWGFASDYARLDIIYQQGGIYLDTDVEIIKNLDELLYQDAFAGVDGSKNISFGLGFGAVPQYRIINAMLEFYENLHFDVNNLTAAPTLMRSLFERYGYINNGNMQKIGGMTVYPEKVLSGKDDVTGRISTTEHTYAIHHYDGSWNDEDRMIRRRKIKELYECISKNKLELA